MIDQLVTGPEIGETAGVAAETRRADRLVFSKLGEQGFGDRHNSWAWCMAWWKGRLYVGGNRAFLCAERAATANGLPFLSKFPFAKYPPEDPDTDCTDDSTDLPLQAEIWRWTPETDRWDRVYQAPADVPIPGHPGKFVARDIGYRGMTAFTEADGSEALYVSGVTAQLLYPNLTAPRLLRSLDGETFEAVSHAGGFIQGEGAPGRVRGMATFRNILTFDGRMFIVAGGIHGDGVLLEGNDPTAGTDKFRQVSPPGQSIFETAVYNGFLYAGTRDPVNGYAVLKTDAAGTAPYTWTTVVERGAYLPRFSGSVISMGVFQNRLYVGTDKPGELICIFPDDSWELVMGTPRETPTGWKYPRSGLDSGFSNWLNGHIWRQVEHQGKLYIGTMKMSTHLRTLRGSEPVFQTNYGFDLYESADGCRFAPITTNGFGDKFAFGIRAFASSPEGLLVGTANSWYGLQIWRGQPAAATGEGSPSPAADGSSPPAPFDLEVDEIDGRMVLSWRAWRAKRATADQRFLILRACLNDQRPLVEKNRFLTFGRWAIRTVRKFKPELYFPPLPDQIWIPGPYEEIGVTERQLFVDKETTRGQRYLYFVVAEDSQGVRSGASNLAAAPSPAPAVTTGSVLQWLDGNKSQNGAGKTAALTDVRAQLQQVQSLLSGGDAAGAAAEMQRLAHAVQREADQHPDLRVVDELALRLQRLNRRVELVRERILPASAVVR